MTNIPTQTMTLTNPTSVLTRPANTTAYAVGNLIASSTTAGSVAVPSFTVAAGAAITALRLVTNKTSGWSGVQLSVRLWTTAPTFTNGDGGAYAVATGAAGYIGTFLFSLIQFGDGAAERGTVNLGGIIWEKLASGLLVYWDLQINTVATPASAQTFTLTAETASIPT